MFLPYRVDVPMERWPWMNWVLIAATIFVSAWMFGPLEAFEVSGLAIGALRYLLLQPDDFHFSQLIGSAFIHAGWLHLIGNMLFLWVFGNAVDAKLGHLRFLAVYLGAAAFEGSVWVLLAPTIRRWAPAGRSWASSGAS